MATKARAGLQKLETEKRNRVDDELRKTLELCEESQTSNDDSSLSDEQFCGGLVPCKKSPERNVPTNGSPVSAFYD